MAFDADAATPFRRRSADAFMPFFRYALFAAAAPRFFTRPAATEAHAAFANTQ